MLIDDNKIDLFVHQRMLQNFDNNISVSMFSSPTLSIQYLEKLQNFDNNISVSMFSSPTLSIQYLENIGKAANIEKETTPDIILLDINMPELNGFQVLKKFETMDVFYRNEIDVIMLSSSQSSIDLDKSKNTTLCKEYLTKPLTLEKIRTAFNSPPNIN